MRFSAGIGRTGTFIVIDILIDVIREKGQFLFFVFLNFLVRTELIWMCEVRRPHVNEHVVLCLDRYDKWSVLVQKKNRDLSQHTLKFCISLFKLIILFLTLCTFDELIAAD